MSKEKIVEKIRKILPTPVTQIDYVLYWKDYKTRIPPLFVVQEIFRGYYNMARMAWQDFDKERICEQCNKVMKFTDYHSRLDYNTDEVYSKWAYRRVCSQQCYDQLPFPYMITCRCCGLYFKLKGEWRENVNRFCCIKCKTEFKYYKGLTKIFKCDDWREIRKTLTREYGRRKLYKRGPRDKVRKSIRGPKKRDNS